MSQGGLGLRNKKGYTIRRKWEANIINHWLHCCRYNAGGFVEELPQLPENRYGHACAALPSNKVRIFQTMHYGSINAFAPPPPIFQGNNCLRQNIWILLWLLIYIWIWIEATAAQELKEILTGWWKDVFWMFGTSWMSCDPIVLVNRNFVRYMHHVLKSLTLWTAFHLSIADL